MFGSLPSETSCLLQPYSNAHGTSVVHQTLCKLPRIFFSVSPRLEEVVGNVISILQARHRQVKKWAPNLKALKVTEQGFEVSTLVPDPCWEAFIYTVLLIMRVLSWKFVLWPLQPFFHAG